MNSKQYSKRVFPIEESSFFRLLSEDEKRELIDSTNRILYRGGETIIKEGFAASHLLYLESGVVKLNVDKGEKRITFKIISPGVFIGLMCSFVNKKLDFSAVAAVDSTLSLIDRAVVEKFIVENGQFALSMVESQSLMTNSVVHHLINLIHKNLAGTVATLLLDLSSAFESLSFTLPFSRGEIADSIGYSKESVINLLSEFAREGLIEVSGRKLTIKDAPKLQRIANYG